MCLVLYRKVVNGRIYPKGARTGPYAYAQEVTRVNGKVTTKYLGIMKVPDKRRADPPADDSGPDAEDHGAGGERVAYDRS